jgi:tripartite-type tricarboxylate transporter receptor subunit TctC
LINDLSGGQAAACGALPVWSSRADPSSSPWRTRPLHVIYPFAPGGGTVDVVLRALDARWQVLYGQPVLTEHRPGATGRLGADAVRRAASDGSTLLLATNDVLVQAQPLGFDPLQAFTPLALIGPVPLVLAVPASRPASRLADFADWARTRRIGYGSWGEASLSQLLGAQLLGGALGLDAAHAPYRGLGPMLRDLAGGQLDAGFAVPPAVAPMAAQGLLRALAVTGPTRSVALPEVPTLAELGHTAPVFGLRAWGALLAPAGMRATDAQALESDVQRAFDDDTMRATLARAGFESGRVARGEDARDLLASDLQVLPPLLRGLAAPSR